MRAHFALAVSLTLGAAPSGLIPARSSLSHCGGADALPLDSSRVNVGLTASIALADLDGDGTLEILSRDAQGYVHIWKADGSRFKHWPKRARGGRIFGYRSVGDIDGDGRLDVVATSHCEVAVYSWRASGGLIRGFPRRIGACGVDFHRGAAMLADLNADALLDVVVGARQGMVHAFTHRFRKEVPGWPVSGGSNFQVTPTSADLDHDGSPEVVLHGRGGVSVVRADRSPFPGWPVDTGDDLDSSPLIVDVDGDGVRDVLVLAADATLPALGANGAAICSPVTLAGLTIAAPVVGDLDGDGLVEVIAPTYGGGIYRVGLPGPWTPSRAAWPMAVADERHTGQLPRC